MALTMQLLLLAGALVAVTGIRWTKPGPDHAIQLEAGDDLIMEWEFRDELSSHLVMISTEYFVVGYWSKHLGTFTQMKGYDSEVEFVRTIIPGPHGSSVGEKIALKIPKCKRNDMIDYTCEVTLDNSRMFQKKLKVEWKGLANLTRSHSDRQPNEPIAPRRQPTGRLANQPRSHSDRQPNEPMAPIRKPTGNRNPKRFFISRVFFACVLVMAVVIVVGMILACYAMKRRGSFNKFKKLNGEKPPSPCVVDVTPIYLKGSDKERLLIN